MTDTATAAPPAPAEAPAAPPAPIDPPAAPAEPGTEPKAEPTQLLGGAPAAPEAPEVFDLDKFVFPEGFEVSDDDKTFLKETGKDLPAAAVKAFVDRYAAGLKSVSDRMNEEVQTAWNETVEGWATETKALYKDNLDPVLVKCEGVLNEFGDDGLKEALKITGLCNHPAVFKFLEKVAGALGEGKAVNPGGEPAGAPNPLAALYPTMVKKD